MKSSLLEFDPDGDLTLVLVHPNQQPIQAAFIDGGVELCLCSTIPLHLQYDPSKNCSEPSAVDFKEENSKPSQDSSDTSEAGSKEKDVSQFEDASKITKLIDFDKVPSIRSDKTPNEVHMKVSSKHLCLASPVFKKMLNGPWIEANTTDGIIRTSKWNIRALVFLLDSIHGHLDYLSHAAEIKHVARVAILANYYDCFETTRTVIYQSVNGFLASRESRSLDSVFAVLGVAWAYSFDDIFEKMARVALRDCKIPFYVLGLEYPQHFRAHFQAKKKEYAQEIFRCLDHITAKLCDIKPKDHAQGMTFLREWKLFLSSLKMASAKDRILTAERRSIWWICEDIINVRRKPWFISAPYLYRDEVTSWINPGLKDIKDRTSRESFSFLCKKRPVMLGYGDEAAVWDLPPKDKAR